MAEAHVVKKLIDIFKKHGVFSSDRAKTIETLFSKKSRPSFINFLLEEGLISRAEALNALSEMYQVPSFDVIGHFFDHELVRKFPKLSMLKHKYIPLEQDQNILIVIASDPSNERLWSEIGSYVSYTLHFMVGLAIDIEDAIKEFYDESLTIPHEAQEVMLEQEEQEVDLDRIMHDWDEE